MPFILFSKMIDPFILLSHLIYYLFGLIHLLDDFIYSFFLVS